MTRKEGFTLIELMIVVAIIAIIAAIAIPNLLSSKISANETSAIAGLNMLKSVEATWQQQNPAGSASKAYWTYDLSCLNRMKRGAGLATDAKVEFIDIAFAKADGKQPFCAANVFGAGVVIDDWTTVPVAPAAKSGYWFQAMVSDEQVPTVAYNTVTVGGNAVPAGNQYKYAFMAAPALYGTTGVRSFIISQGGTTYAVDTGLEASKWKTTVALTLQWPDADPTKVDGPVVGKKWSVAE